MKIKIRQAKIPLEELGWLRQFVCWRTMQRRGKLVKVPINPHTGKFASVRDPTTWGSYQEAEKLWKES
ncbi:hypothetical protein DRP07_11525 [Archaeoglobales archaeon]|nr:MAG: hypothetical protein DRP07_11525 [Archaeoglobales archaeon]